MTLSICVYVKLTGKLLVSHKLKRFVIMFSMGLHRFYLNGFHRLESNKWKLSRHLKIKCYFCTVQNHLSFLLTISFSFSCILLCRSVGLSIEKYCWVFSVFVLSLTVYFVQLNPLLLPQEVLSGENITQLILATSS